MDLREWIIGGSREAAGRRPCSTCTCERAVGGSLRSADIQLDGKRRVRQMVRNPEPQGFRVPPAGRDEVAAVAGPVQLGV